MKGSERVPRRRRWRRSGPRGTLAVFFCGVACAVPACAAAAAVNATQAGCAWPIAGSVEALLQAETDAALQARPGVFSQRVPSPRGGMQHGPEAGPGGSDQVAVAAIYGVGRRLHIDVRINGQIARYHNGQRWPEHAPEGGAGIYALASVRGECVRLQRDAAARIACLYADASTDARRK